MTPSLSETERTSILQGLESGDDEVRRMSVEQLRLLPHSEALPRLIVSLGDPGWRVRKAAVEALISRPADAEMHECLVEALADGENPGRRNSAFEALVGCGRRVTQRLIRELTNDDVDVRKLAVDGLAAIGDPVACEALVDASGDADVNVRAAAVEALGAVGGESEVAHLLRLAKRADEDLLVRLSALRAVVHMGARAGVAELGGSLQEPSLRPAALELLGRAEDPAAVDELLKGLSDRSPSSREAAMRGLLTLLGRVDGAEAERLAERARAVATADDRLLVSACERLERADLAQQMVLIQFLGLLGDARVVLPILGAARDDALRELCESTLESLGDALPAALEPVWGELESDAKRQACRCLGRLGGTRSESLLVVALLADDPELRCEAAVALARAGCFARIPELVQSLESAARDEDVESREEVAALTDALVDLAGHSEAARCGADVQLIETLAARLVGAGESVRLAIARVLARIGRVEDRALIGDLLKDEAPAVRRAAVRALSRFDFDRAEEALRLALADESATVRIAAAQVLGETDRTEAVEDLRPLLLDEDPAVAAVAVRSAGRLHRGSTRSPEDVYPLVEGALQGEPIVALAACEALLEVGGPRACALAAPLLDRPEPEVVRAAVACMAAHGTREELIPLASLISHGDWSVRADAVQVLTERGVQRALPDLLRRMEFEEDEFVRNLILRAAQRLEG